MDNNLTSEMYFIVMKDNRPIKIQREWLIQSSAAMSIYELSNKESWMQIKLFFYFYLLLWELVNDRIDPLICDN